MENEKLWQLVQSMTNQEGSVQINESGEAVLKESFLSNIEFREVLNNEQGVMAYYRMWKV